MAYDTPFNADDLDLDAALLAGFGVVTETDKAEVSGEDAARVVSVPEQPTGHALVAHARITERVGTVGRLQVTFVYHHGEGPHE